MTPHSGRRCPSITSELGVAQAQGRGPASPLLRDEAGDWVRWGGVCPAEDPHPLAWRPGSTPGESDGIQRRAGKCSPGRGQGGRPRGSVPCWGAQGKQNQIQTPNKSSPRRGPEKKLPFPGGIPTDLAQDRVRAHSPLPSAPRKTASGQTNPWAQGSRPWGCQGPPQWRLASSVSVSPPCEGLACSPQPSTEPQGVWEADWDHLGRCLARPRAH